MTSRTLKTLPSALLSLALFSNCGGGDNPAAPTTGTPPAPPPANATRTVILNKDFSLLPGTATFQNVDLPPAGTLDATVDWGGSNDINLFVTDNSCPGFVDLRAGRCNVVARSDSATAKPERVSFTTVAGRIWTFWIANNGTSAESGAMEVGITSTTPPAPTPTPTPGSGPADPQANLAPGPVARYTIKVRTIDQGGFDYRDPFADIDGNWIVHKDEFVVFDSTQKNAAGELCKWTRDPVWTVRDPGGVFRLRGSSQPFLLRVDILKNTGTVEVEASIDGVRSNVLTILSTKR